MTACTTTPAPDNVTDAQMKTLLASSLHTPALLEKFHIPRFKLRLATIHSWGVQEGNRLLDIGCGQGESSVALAAVVGDSGHITALDTASMDYGHPFTMRAAHEHIQQSVLGPRISFYPLDAQTFFAEQRRPTDAALDGAVLCQSLFYFPDEGEVRALFATLRRAGVARIYAAEWSYAASRDAQRAHILATAAQALFYRCKPPQHRPGLLREQNVRAGVDQQAILRAARAAGYKVAREMLVTPGDDMREGEFEVGFVLGPVFAQRVAETELSQGQKDEIGAAIDKVKVELEKPMYAGGTAVKSMDVWCAIFEMEE